MRYLFPPLTLRRPCNSGSSTGPVLQREDTTNEEDTNEGRHQQEAQLLVARPRRGGPAGAGLLAAAAAIMYATVKMTLHENNFVTKQLQL